MLTQYLKVVWDYYIITTEYRGILLTLKTKEQMSQLKEQNGRYYQKVEVVMLATEKESNIMLRHNRLYLFKNDNTIPKGTSKNQHLYFLSDDEIKEGDWCLYGFNLEKDGVKDYPIDSSDILQCTGFSQNKYLLHRDGNTGIENCKKIIATTDESLEIRFENHNDFDSVFELPKPSDSFIKKYIEEYNVGRQITKVLVEYVKHPIENYWYLHTDSDYEITITKLKDNYSREEVIKLLNSAMIAAGNHGKRIQAYYMTDIGNPPLTLESFTNQWIEENL